MQAAKPDILTINGGSSSIKFALYQSGEPLARRLHGTLDRIGGSGTTLTFHDSTGNPPQHLIVAASNYQSAANVLIDWLERQPDFDVVGAVGHRVVQGMSYAEPAPVTPEMLDALHSASDTSYYKGDGSLWVKLVSDGGGARPGRGGGTGGSIQVSR